MRKLTRALNCTLLFAVGAGGLQTAYPRDEPKKHHEIKYEITISAKPAQQRCAASLEFTFQQRNTLAVVDSTLRNSDCAASSGEYTMLVKTRHDNGESKTLEFPVTWQREDDQALESHAEYSIGEDVDLISVRSRRMRCLCAADAEDESAPEE